VELRALAPAPAPAAAPPPPRAPGAPPPPRAAPPVEAYETRAPGELAAALAALRERVLAHPRPAAYHPPEFERMRQAERHPFAPLARDGVRRQIACLLRALPEERLTAGLPPCADAPPAAVVEATLARLRPAPGAETDFDFVEFEKFGLTKAAFLEARRVVGLTNLFGKLVAAFLESELRDHSDDPVTRRLVEAVAATLLNGLATAALRDALAEMGDIAGVAEVLAQLEPDAPNASAALCISAKLLESGLVWTVFDWIRENDAWVRKHYRRAAYVADDSFLEDVPIYLLKIVNEHLFARVPVPPVSPSLERFESKGGFVHIDINELLAPTEATDPVRVIVRQFENGTKGKQTAWAAIGAVVAARAPPRPEHWDALADAVKRNTQTGLARLTKAADAELLGLVRDGLATKQIHIWFLYIALSQPILKQFYYRDATLRDLSRARYVAAKILAYVNAH
jgi:hypothetical protein